MNLKSGDVVIRLTPHSSRCSFTRVRDEGAELGKTVERSSLGEAETLARTVVADTGGSVFVVSGTGDWQQTWPVPSPKLAVPQTSGEMANPADPDRVRRRN